MTARKPAGKASSKRPPAKKAPARKRPARKPAAPPPIDLADELRDLRAALRSRLTDPKTPGSAVAAISRELRAVNAELAALVPEEVSSVDEVAARRAIRRAGTADSPPPSRRSQPRRRGGGARSS